MQRQLDESIKVTTMSMDISIDEDSWNSSSQHNDRSSSTLNLTYERGESGGDGEHQVEEDHGDDGRGVDSHEDEEQQDVEEEDNRRSPNRQRLKDEEEEEEEEASDIEEGEDEQANTAEYEEEEEQKEEEGIMLCMPVATAQVQVSSTSSVIKF